MTTRAWKIYGPFDMDKNSALSWKALFRAQVGDHTGLCHAAGVYVITVCNRQNEKIRYIGMTHQQGFESEIFPQRNNHDVWSVIQLERSRTIRVWLFAKPYPVRTGFSYYSSLKHQSHILESLLIMHARAAGHDLINTKKMKAADGIAVEGLFGVRKQGKKSAAAAIMSKVLRLD